MADHLYIRYGERPGADLGQAQVLWVEYKRPGGVVKRHQLLWHGAERARGAMTACAILDFVPTYDGFVEWYRKSGLLLRKGL